MRQCIFPSTGMWVIKRILGICQALERRKEEIDEPGS